MDIVPQTEPTVEEQPAEGQPKSLYSYISDFAGLLGPAEAEAGVLDRGAKAVIGAAKATKTPFQKSMKAISNKGLKTQAHHELPLIGESTVLSKGTGPEINKALDQVDWYLKNLPEHAANPASLPIKEMPTVQHKKITAAAAKKTPAKAPEMAPEQKESLLALLKDTGPVAQEEAEAKMKAFMTNQQRSGLMNNVGPQLSQFLKEQPKGTKVYGMGSYFNPNAAAAGKHVKDVDVAAVYPSIVDYIENSAVTNPVSKLHVQAVPPRLAGQTLMDDYRKVAIKRYGMGGYVRLLQLAAQVGLPSAVLLSELEKKEQSGVK